MKECVHAFAEQVRPGAPLSAQSASLARQVEKISHLVTRVIHASTKGIVDYLDLVGREFPQDHPGVNFSLEISDAFRDTKLGPDQSMFLLLSIIELIDNATDALEGSGTLRLRARIRESDRTLVFSVHNSGRISGNIGERIFLDGVSTKGEGRGMGLAIVGRMSERFRARLELRQESGVEFVLSLSLLQP
jgi:nitrogen fixation/metabolism regulation signal transduction histidine kinase